MNSRRWNTRRLNSRRCLAALIALLAGACSGATVADPRIITVGIRSSPNNLDPRRANDEVTARVGQLVFTPLMDWSNDLHAVPKLAHRLDHPDPLTYIAHLRRGVMFHDGHELTSKDVVYTYKSLLDPAFVSPYKSAFRALASIRGIDAYTVEFKLTEPFAAFPLQLITPPIVPDGAGESLSSFPIGTGPYRFVRYAVDDRVEFSAFEGYYDGLPNNAGVVLKIIPDDTMRGLELRKGTVDMTINDMPPDIIHQLESSGRVKVDRSPGLDFYYVGFNMRDPILSDKRVRHAIGYAINRQAIVEYLRRGLARPAVGLVTSLAWAHEPDVFQFTYDPARARRLLDEAGYPDPDGDGPLPRLTLTMKISTNEEYRLQCIVMQEDLKRVGINLDLRSYEFATMFADVLNGNFQVTGLQWVGGAVGDPDILRRVYHSSQMPPVGFNRGRFNNPEVDRLIDLATVAITDEERRRYYSAVQKLVADEAVYIPIWSRINAVVARPGLTGMRINPMGDFQALANATKAVTP
jgi:peptide/nickel transport system substrate-binding protein